jgi:hypothetical protein
MTTLPTFRFKFLYSLGYGQGGYGEGPYGGGSYYNPSLQYYLNLFTSQYQNSAKYLRWTQLAWQPISDLVLCLTLMSTNFNLIEAVGNQLDILGEVIGISRTLPFQPSGGRSPVLDDYTYRLLLNATILKNKWDGKLVSIYNIWSNLFPSGRIIINDNQNMTATIIISGSFDSLIVDLIENGFIVPRPEGVQYTYTLATLPIFGADLNNSYIAGADLGHAI